MESRYFDQKETFPFLDIISDNFSIIEKELKNSEWFDWPEYNLWNKKGFQWQISPLFGFGIWLEDDNFQETIKILKKIPGLKTAIFSRIGTKTRLNPHQGWASLSNEVLRCQLGIKIPTDGKSGIVVENEFRQVEKGKWLIFDDSKIHSALNEGSSDRIVLILDIERPKWVAKGKSKVKETLALKKFIEQFKRK